MPNENFPQYLNNFDSDKNLETKLFVPSNSNIMNDDQHIPQTNVCLTLDKRLL